MEVSYRDSNFLTVELVVSTFMNANGFKDFYFIFVSLYSVELLTKKSETGYISKDVLFRSIRLSVVGKVILRKSLFYHDVLLF